MIPRVQSAIDVKRAISSASSELTEIGFDASVLEEGYKAIQTTCKQSTGRYLSPSSDEDTLVVPGGGIINNTQMVRHLSDCRVLNV